MVSPQLLSRTLLSRLLELLWESRSAFRYPWVRVPSPFPLPVAALAEYPLRLPLAEALVEYGERRYRSCPMNLSYSSLSWILAGLHALVLLVLVGLRASLRPL